MQHLEKGQVIPATARSAVANKQFVVNRAKVVDRLPARELESLTVGQELEGVVVCRVEDSGYFVDVGAGKQAWLDAGELVDGFPVEGRQTLRLGDVVVARVLHNNFERFCLTRRPGSLERPPAPEQEPGNVKGFVDAGPSDWFEGEVQSIRFFGVKVRVAPPAGGAPCIGIVHKDHGFRDGFEKEVVVGMKVKVRVQSVDIDEQKLVLTLRDP